MSQKLKVTNLGALETRYFVLPENSVLISINEENGELFPLEFIDRAKVNEVLTLRFSDVTAPVGDGKHSYNPITKKQAIEIIDFIDYNKEKNFYVHCAAGVSRSGAIVLFIHLTLGHELRDSYWSLSEPNPFVLGRLFAEKNRKVISELDRDYIK